MTKLIAIHALHLAGAVKGTVDVVNPGEGFEAREDELYLAKEGFGAARKATAEDKAAVFITRSGDKAASSAPAAQEDLSKMKKADLVALAAAEEIAIDETATNAVIIKAIEDGRAAKQDELV